jgi:branched-subunit amino acid transport protein AzlD
MNNLQVWAVISGSLMPTAVAFVEQAKWPTWFRATVMVISSVLMAVLVIYLQEGTLRISSQDWLTTILLIVATAQVAYEKFWKRTTIAPLIEWKTSPKEQSPPPPVTTS